MYPSRNGRPSTPPQVLAVTVVLQALYGLPDQLAGASVFAGHGHVADIAL
jgi:hypothetical protein